MHKLLDWGLSQHFSVAALIFPLLSHSINCPVFSVRKHQWQLRQRLVPGDGLRLHRPAHTCFWSPSASDLQTTHSCSLRVAELCLGKRCIGNEKVFYLKRKIRCEIHPQQLLFTFILSFRDTVKAIIFKFSIQFYIYIRNHNSCLMVLFSPPSFSVLF